MPSLIQARLSCLSGVVSSRRPDESPQPLKHRRRGSLLPRHGPGAPHPHHLPDCPSRGSPLLRLDLLVLLDGLDVFVALHGVDGALVKGDPFILVSISNGCTWVGDKNVLLEPLDQRVLVADLASLVFGMLLGPAVHQRVNQESDLSGRSPYASTCSGVASFLQVTWNMSEK